MKIVVFEDRKALAKAAASIIASEILSLDEPVLGLATGGTPVETYQELIALHQAGVLDFSEVKSFNLDEYIGISYEHPESYHKFMQRQLFDHINMPEDAHEVPDGAAKDVQWACDDYEMAIEEAGGIDLQLLGLGHNGHIAFNEPDVCFSQETHVVDLTQQTIEANARFFDHIDDVPKQAITMGIGTIMSAGKILLLATGIGKAEAVKKMVEGPIDPQCPASILQTHPDVVVLLDQDAASLLSEA